MTLAEVIQNYKVQNGLIPDTTTSAVMRVYVVTSGNRIAGLVTSDAGKVANLESDTGIFIIWIGNKWSDEV